MRSVIWIFLVVIIFSCKTKNGTNSSSSGSSASSQTESDTSSKKEDIHEHFYRIHKGNLIGFTGAPSNNIFGECVFDPKNPGDNKNVYYFKGTDTALEIGKTQDTTFYFIINKENKRPGLANDKLFLLLKNNALPINSHVEGAVPKDLTAPQTKGNLGCFPKFIIKNGELDYYTLGNKRYIQLPMAYHDHHNQVIDTLELRSFAITIDNYNLINNKLKDQPSLQGGMNKKNTNEIIIYPPDSDTELLRITGDN